MATSPFPTTQHTSEHIVESAGAVLFRLSTHEICLLHLLSRDEYLLPKGRRNIGETIHQAAIREVREETGYQRVRLLPVKMGSRAPPAIETEPSAGDVLRVYDGIQEPFMLQIRRLQSEGDVKLVWWFIAEVEEEEAASGATGSGEERYEVHFCGYEEAVEKLTFQLDRDMVKQAVEIVEASGH